MAEGLSIDVGSALPFLEDRILSIFGKDYASLERKHKVRTLIQTAFEHAAFVQCVGMAKPIPISELYQPSRLIGPPPARGPFDVKEVLAENTNILVFAGPGWGKTTLLHWIYYNLCGQSPAWQNPGLTEHVPILFTLRWPNATSDLHEFVSNVASGKAVTKKASRILLLVDGYDELTEADRQLVSKELVLFQTLDVGHFWMTCRSSYHVYDVRAAHYEIAPFEYADSLGFARSFLTIYGVELSPVELLKELYDHRFQDFASHPLMLALVCILKSGPNREIPRRAIGLIRRAIDTLTFRWDEAKGIYRESKIPLDGEERVRCLMRIAYDMNHLQTAGTNIEQSLREHFALIQVKGVEMRRLLQEIVQWYGLLIPVDAENWQFVHRSIQDYLAARHWVESGQFLQASLPNGTVRAAYAACLVPDGTVAIVRMLRLSTEFEPFVECLYNSAFFENTPVATALIDRVSSRHEYTYRHGAGTRVSSLHVSLKHRFITYASGEFLRTLLRLASEQSTDGGDALALAALRELQRRGEPAEGDALGGRLKSIYLMSPNIVVEVQEFYPRTTWPAQFSELIRS